jgi:hypothetical protein
MNRRAWLVGCLGLFTAPLRSAAQPVLKGFRIGILAAFGPTDPGEEGNMNGLLLIRSQPQMFFVRARCYGSQNGQGVERRSSPTSRATVFPMTF